MKQNLAKLVTKESVLQALQKFEKENPDLLWVFININLKQSNLC